MFVETYFRYNYLILLVLKGQFNSAQGNEPGDKW